MQGPVDGRYFYDIISLSLATTVFTALSTAREKTVTGAVSRVEMALSELSAKRLVQLDDERKAAMVSTT